MKTPPIEAHTITEAAKEVGIPAWQLSRLYERGFLPPPRKFGAYRIIFAHELPAIAEAARKAGYLSAEAVSA